LIVLNKKRNRIKYNLFLALVLGALNSYGQSKTIYQTNQKWIGYSNQWKLTQDFYLDSDLSYRLLNNNGEWTQITLRTGFRYSLSKELQGVSGIACFLLFKNNEIFRKEYRPFQDFISYRIFENFSLQNRYRVEARYFVNILDSGDIPKSNFNFRLRYKIIAAIPILNFKRNKVTKTLFLNIGDEILINAGKEIIYNMFDNNRLTAGLTYQFNPEANLTINYIYQYGQRNKPATYEESNIFTIGFNQKIGSR
jgi:hypothetical protein